MFVVARLSWCMANKPDLLCSQCVQILLALWNFYGCNSFFKLRYVYMFTHIGLGLKFGYLGLRSRFIMKVTQDPITWDILRGTNRFTTWRVKFKWSTPPSFSSNNDYSHFKTSSPLSLVNTLLLWDMENIYGTTKEPWWYSRVVGIIRLNISSKSSIANVICNTCIIPSGSHFSWYGMVYFNI